MTGLPCPACGMTRSWVYLMHGWWGHALAANALGVVLALAVIALGARRLSGAVPGLHPARVDLHALATARITWALAWVPWTTFALARIAWYASGRGGAY